jgi:hypothetical protein
MGMVILQNCMDLETDVPGSCSETFPTFSHDANQVISIKGEEPSDVEEQKDPLTFPRIKIEHEVSFMSVCHCDAYSTDIHYCLLSFSSPSLHLSFQMKQLHTGKWVLNSPF